MSDENNLLDGLAKDANDLHAEATHAVAEAHEALHDAAAHHGGKHVDHPPEPPTMLGIWYEQTKPAPGATPTASQKLAENLMLGPLEHKLPIINYAPWDGHFFLLIACLLTVLMSVLSTRQFRSNRANAMREPSRGQIFIEWVVESMDKFVCGVLGPVHGRKYLPFIGTLFVLILISNLMGMVPLMKPPTASLVITLSLALCTFIVVQYTALTKLGPGKLFMHLCGDPKDAIGYVLAPLFFVLEVIGVIAKPISLSLRLFGNMLGKDILLGAFTMMGIMLVAVVSKDLSHYVGAPLTIPFYFLGILLSAIQALVFSILSAIYILLMLPHEHHDHDDHGHGHDAPGHAPLEGAHAH
jgi:F-type H+-transporting ATPase subunit a